MKYAKTIKYWSGNAPGHRDNSDETCRKIADTVMRVCQFATDDWVLDIGCGDGRVAMLIQSHVQLISGYDISPAMIKRATDNGLYCWVQSFLYRPTQNHYTAAFSVGTMQYCHPEDIFLFIARSLDAVGPKAWVHHLEVPDAAKMRHLYLAKRSPRKLLSGLARLLFYKVTQALVLHVPIWKDGSYWHDMNHVGRECEKLGVSVWFLDSDVKYRTHIKIFKK